MKKGFLNSNGGQSSAHPRGTAQELPADLPDLEDFGALSSHDEEMDDEAGPKHQSARAKKRSRHARNKRNAAKIGATTGSPSAAAPAWSASDPAAADGSVTSAADKLSAMHVGNFEFKAAASPPANTPPTRPAQEDPDDPDWLRPGESLTRIPAAAFAPDLCKFLGGFGPHDEEIQRIEGARGVRVDPRSSREEVRVYGPTAEAVAAARTELEMLFASLQERRVALDAAMAGDVMQRVAADLKAGSVAGWPLGWSSDGEDGEDGDASMDDEEPDSDDSEGGGWRPRWSHSRRGVRARRPADLVLEGSELLLRGRGLALSELQRLADAVSAHADALARPHESRVPIFASQAAYIEQEELGERIAGQHRGVAVRVDRERTRKAPQAWFAPERDDARSVAHYLVVRAEARLYGERAAADVRAALQRLQDDLLEREVHRILNAATPLELLGVQADTDRGDIDDSWRALARLLLSARGREGAPRRLEKALARAGAAARAATLGWGFDEAPNSTGQLLEARVDLSEDEDEALRDLVAAGKLRTLATVAGEAARQAGRPWFQPHVAVLRVQDGPDLAVVFRSNALAGVQAAVAAYEEEHAPAVAAETARRAKVVYETVRIATDLYDAELGSFVEARVRSGGLRVATSVQSRSAAAVLLRLEGRLGDVEVLKAAIANEVSVLEARARARAAEEAARRRRAEQERMRREQQRRRGYGDDPFGGFYGGGFGGGGRGWGAPPQAPPVCPLAHIDESKIPAEDRAAYAEIKRIVKAKGGPHEALGVDRNAGESEVKKAYYNLARKFHPDKCSVPGADEAFKKITAAYEEIAQGPGEDPFGGMGGGGGGGIPTDFFNQFFRQQYGGFR